MEISRGGEYTGMTELSLKELHHLHVHIKKRGEEKGGEREGGREREREGERRGGGERKHLTLSCSMASLSPHTCSTPLADLQ